MKPSTLRWPFPDDLAHRPDIFPCECLACRTARAGRRVGDFDGRPAPIHGPDVEIGAEFDMRGAGGAYRSGWFRDDTGNERRERLR